MTIQPTGSRVAVQVRGQPDRTSTIHLSEHTETADLTGEVVAVGRDAPPELSVGDTVLFSRYVGTEVVNGGRAVLVMDAGEIKVGIR